VARRAPELSGTLQQDASVVAAHVQRSEQLLAALPPKPARDERQQTRAERLFEPSRALRNRFILRHAEAVYEALTDGRSEHRRLSELASMAAEHFPGLVPTGAQIATERERIQAHKDGREIDQGIFFRGLLRSPRAGAHLAEAMLLPTPRARDLLGDFARDGLLDLGTVQLERRDEATHVTFCNYHCLNAEDDRLVADLETAVDLVLLDPASRVGVLRGAPMRHPRYLGRRVFSAGINLAELYAGRISFVGFLLGREFGCLAKLLRGVLVDPCPDAFPERTVQKPWIAAVDAFAIGGGMQLLLGLDRVIAAEDAWFRLPAAQEGIVPGAGNLRLGRLTGSRLARRIVLAGHTIRATDPDAVLVCDEVVAEGRMDDAVARAVRELADPAVVANRRMLGLAEEPPDRFRAYMAEFALTQALRLYSDDIVAKLEQRWSGRPRQA
jgi:thioesterase DpgC